MLLLVVLAKLTIGVAALAIGGLGLFGIDERPQMEPALITYGLLLLAHETFFFVRGVVESTGTPCERIARWVASQLDPEPGAATVSEKRFALEGDKQMLTWLTAAAGLITGLVAFGDPPEAHDIEKLGVGAFVVSVVSGILYMNVMAGAIDKEEDHELQVEKFNHELALVFLNVAYWSFCLGILAIFFGMLSLPPRS